MARTLPRHLLDTTTADLRAIADFENRKYPQYAGHWDGPEWILVEITTDVRTKLGRAFFAGELARVESTSFSAVARELGVSDNAVRKRLRSSMAEQRSLKS